MQLIDIFEKYYENSNQVGEPFVKSIWIRSNNFYIFFGEKERFGKTYAMFSKKYFITVELTKDKKHSKILDEIAKVIDEFRSKNNLVVEKYSFWLPHCLVNGNTVNTQLVAESFGVSRNLALEYLKHYDKVFEQIYNSIDNTYFGLPLFDTYEKAEEYQLSDNTEKYLRGLSDLNSIIKKLRG